jgi:hypothetical protein
MSSERRTSPRIEILGRVHGQAVSLGVPVTVREISLGGMAIETPVPFPMGALHEFRLTLGDGSTVLLRARVVHCRPAGKASDTPVFVSGMHFVDDEAITGQTVGDFIERIR